MACIRQDRLPRDLLVSLFLRDLLPRLHKGLWHQYVDGSLDELHPVLFTSDLLRQLHYFLQIQVLLGGGVLHPEAGVCGESVVLQLSLLPLLLQHFEGLRQSVKEDVVRVVGTLRLVRVLDVAKVQRLQIQPLERLLERVPNEVRMETVSAFLHDGLFGYVRLGD